MAFKSDQNKNHVELWNELSLPISMRKQRLDEAKHHFEWQPQRRFNLLFISVPKNAGTSIAKTPLVDINGNLQPEIGSRCHQGYDYYYELNKLGRITLGDTFIFGFVRNPWSRLVSLYRNRKERHKCNNFEDFVEKYQFASDFQVAPANYRNQIDWFKNPDTGAVDVNFIGRYENLNTDLNFVLNQVGLRVKSDVLHLCGNNKSGPLPKVDYRDFYTAHTKDVVYEKCREDIEYFNYEF